MQVPAVTNYGSVSTHLQSAVENSTLKPETKSQLLKALATITIEDSIIIAGKPSLLSGTVYQIDDESSKAARPEWDIFSISLQNCAALLDHKMIDTAVIGEYIRLLHIDHTILAEGKTFIMPPEFYTSLLLHASDGELLSGAISITALKYLKEGMLCADNMFIPVSEHCHFSLIHLQHLEGLKSTADQPGRIAFIDSLPGIHDQQLIQTRISNFFTVAFCLKEAAYPDTHSLAIFKIPTPTQLDSTSCGIQVMAALAFLLNSLPPAFGTFKAQAYAACKVNNEVVDGLRHYLAFLALQIVSLAGNTSLASKEKKIGTAVHEKLGKSLQVMERYPFVKIYAGIPNDLLPLPWTKAKAPKKAVADATGPQPNQLKRSSARAASRKPPQINASDEEEEEVFQTKSGRNSKKRKPCSQ